MTKKDKNIHFFPCKNHDDDDGVNDDDSVDDDDGGGGGGICSFCETIHL